MMIEGQGPDRDRELLITVKVKKEAKKVGTVERVMRQSTAIPEPSFWLVRSGDAKIDCRIAGARCSENGGSGDKKKLTLAFSLEIAGGLLEGGLRVCAPGEEFYYVAL